MYMPLFVIRKFIFNVRKQNGRNVLITIKMNDNGFNSDLNK